MHNTILSLVGTPKFGGIPPNLVVKPPNLGVLPLNLGVSPPNLGVIKKINVRNLKKKLLGKLKNIILYYFLNMYFQHLFKIKSYLKSTEIDENQVKPPPNLGVSTLNLGVISCTLPHHHPQIWGW